MNFSTLFILSSALLFAFPNEKSEPVKVGSTIPSFSLYDQDSTLFAIDSVRGTQNLVIYFYPKDDSPGCTAEACSFRDQYEAFRDADAMVIGISEQSVASHKAFAEKHHLNFTLLSDEGNKVRKLFGVPSSLFGLISGRVTYVVDKTGTVIYTFNSQFRAKTHVEKALEILQGME